MSAEYTSTARALALPISPPQSPSPERTGGRPAWSERIASRSRRDSPYGSGGARSQLVRNAMEVQEKALVIYNKLSLLQKVLGTLALLGCAVVGTLFLVYNERFFGMLIPYAEKWRDTRGGWIILWLIIIVAAFPPLIGYSSTLTIAGFVYGFPSGWYIATTATVIGSTCSFLASRTILSKYVARLVGQDKRFEALALTLQHDGLKILVMIRFCPLPYSLSNAAMSTFPTVHPLSFALATLLSCPKLLIPIFIGSRMASIGEGGEGMSIGTKLLNYFSILFGVSLGVGIGYYIYQRTTARARELEAADVESAQRIVVPVRGPSYTDDAADMDAAAIMGDDDISLWDNADADPVYRDDFTDDEDVFAVGDADSEHGRRK